MTQETFEQLLNWLDRDRELAGARYEEIRFRLIKNFASRGCLASEELADETINRVTRKVKDLAGTYTGDPALYFYGVAKIVYLEYLRRKPALPPEMPSQAAEDAELRRDCLKQCMERLTPVNRELIVAYYEEGNQMNADRRRELAERMGLEPNALWVRVHRIRDRLRGCVGECFKNK
ncbi:MAG TPA: hypothetical protein VF747_15960 [Blastocatellia bacterium]